MCSYCSYYYRAARALLLLLLPSTHTSLSLSLPPPAQGHDLQAMLDAATKPQHNEILTFHDMRAQVLHEMRFPDEYSGTPVVSMPRFTQLVKGFRRGELVVITGPTGSGKTTLLSQLSVDFAEQAKNVLWGSFEVPNVRLVQKMLRQFARPASEAAFGGSGAQLEAIADRFETLPLHFMRFFGGSHVDAVLDAMEFAVYVHDVEHIILDNLQFMLSRRHRGAAFSDRFDQQDEAVERFRLFASQHNVQVTLVCHPRKEDDGQRLGLSSLYGSAKATQEADMVLIIQNGEGGRKILDVKKNRYDGALGSVPLHFVPPSARYLEIGEGVPGMG